VDEELDDVDVLVDSVVDVSWTTWTYWSTLSWT
jgi:hypothetical protein